MAIRGVAATVLVGAVLMAGCRMQALPEVAMVVDGVPSGECVVHPTPGPGPFLQCPIAIDLAVDKLGLLPGAVTAVDFHFGVLCPPNARCLLSTDRGTVVFWFADAAPVMVPINHEQQAGFVAGEPVAAPQWLIDQGAAAEGAS